MKRIIVEKIMGVLLVVVMLGACSVLPPQISQSSTGQSVEPPQTVADSPVATVQATEAEPTQEVVNTPEPVKIETPSAWIAYVGVDGNIWLAGGAPMTQVQITHDATGSGTGDVNAPIVLYNRPKWSSDGALLAFERQEGTPEATGYTFQGSVWIYNQSTGTAQLMVNGQQTSGFDWWPGKHILAYSEAIDLNYFRTGSPDPACARGIRLFDADHPDVWDLVRPERGFHLAAPKWSPDGRFLSFKEIYLTEGDGMLAMYDLDAQKYIAWDEQIGSYAWSSDSETIIYDSLTYIPQGDEAIFTRPRGGGEARRLSPQYENGYAYSPAVTKDGSLVAFLVDRDGLEGNMSTLVVMDVANGKTRELGNFDNARFPSWSAGWSNILLTRGSYDSSEIVLVSPFDGSTTILAQGSQPDWNPAVQLQ